MLHELFSSCGEQGPLFLGVSRLLIAVVSLVEHRFQGEWISVVASCGLGSYRSRALERGLNSLSSAGKESACNARNPSSIPGSGRSVEEGVGYPLQCSWPSRVAQLVKSPPVMWETWVGKIP